MSYSRRQLYALGEPLGDCATRLKPGGRVYGGGDSGGGGQPEKTTQTVELPEWARPYAKDTLAKGAALTDINKNPYQQYGGERIAGFQPLQQQAFKTVGGMDAGPAGFQAGIGQYMSPYMQNVVDIEKREAGRQAGIAGTQQQAQATQAGAFGGGRDAIMRAERERNLSQQMGDIQSRGSQAAYDQAANQFRQGITQQSGLAQMQGQMGAQQQQQAQRPLDMAYQDFLNQQNYPYKQLGFMSDMIRGLPLGQQSTSQVYSAPPSLMGQLGGLGMGAYGLSRMMAEGGEVTSQGNKDAIVDDMYSIEGLQAAKEAALNRRDMDTVAAIDERIAQLTAIQAQSASLNYGLGSAFDQIPQERQEEIMYAANGGIVAFADRGAVVDPDELTPADYNLPTLKGIRDFFTPKAALENRQRYEKGLAENEKAKAAASASAVDASNKTDAMRNASRAAQAKTNNERVAPAPKQKKLSPTIDKAVTKMAEEQGVPKEDFMDMYDKVRGKLQAESKEDLQGLQDLIDKQSGKSKEIKEKALGKALAEFGFNMAAQASKTGRESKGQGIAGLLGSASAAAPTLAASFAESEKLAAAADENDMKLQIEMRKFNIATRKNDSTAAMQAATNMRQLQQSQAMIQQQQAQLAETHRANVARERLQGQQIAARSGTSGLRGMQYVARSRAEAMKLAQKEVDSKIRGGMAVVKPEDYDRMLNQAMKKYLPITTGFGMTGVSSSKDDDDIIDLD
jgi:hypothetical protein